jgi:hypothetical protein
MLGNLFNDAAKVFADITLNQTLWLTYIQEATNVQIEAGHDYSLLINIASLKQLAGNCQDLSIFIPVGIQNL